MIDNFKIGVNDPHLDITDFTWTGDINIMKDANKIGYIDYMDAYDYHRDSGSYYRETKADIRKRRSENISYSKYMKFIFTHGFFLFWPVLIIIGTLSYYKQKKNIANFSEENPEYFI